MVLFGTVSSMSSGTVYGRRNGVLASSPCVDRASGSCIMGVLSTDGGWSVGERGFDISVKPEPDQQISPVFFQVGG